MLFLHFPINLLAGIALEEGERRYVYPAGERHSCQRIVALGTVGMGHGVAAGTLIRTGPTHKRTIVQNTIPAEVPNIM